MAYKRLTILFHYFQIKVPVMAFVKGGKLEVTEKRSQSKDKKQQQI